MRELTKEEIVQAIACIDVGLRMRWIPRKERPSAINAKNKLNELFTETIIHETIKEELNKNEKE